MTWTPRLWIQAAELNKASDYERFKGMTAEEIYDEIYAQIAPLDAIVKAVNDDA
jgi:hypothetical protein